MKIAKPIKVGKTKQDEKFYVRFETNLFENYNNTYFIISLSSTLPSLEAPDHLLLRLSSVFYRSLNKSAIVFFLWTSVTTRRNYEPNILTFTLHPRSPHRICMCQG